MADESKQLLQQFSRERSESAFRELVRQHSPVVYGTALRMLGGDRAAAQDVTQEVFTLLVRKASRLGDVALSAWLYRQACRRASNHVRAESRRKQRELVAADLMNNSSAPNDADLTEVLNREVDSALLELPSTDRDALVLRYFEGQDFRKLGTSLGTTEEAARKRVTRAIEKLAAALQRKGIPVGTASLGTTMASLGATPVPASVVSQVTAHALKALPTAGGTGLMSWLKPFLAGVLLSSLAAITTLAIQRQSEPIASVTPAPPPPREDSRPSYLRPISSSASLEDLIAEIKRANAGPRHAMTRLRISAILERIRPDQMPDFFFLAHDNLTTAEQAACYEPLLARWAQEDPVATLNFGVEHNYWKKVDELKHSNMLNNIFATWMRRDLDAAQTWLLEHWSAKGLKDPAFEGSLGEFLALQIANERVGKTGVNSAITFVQAMPDEKTRRRALLSLAGEDDWMSAWRYADDKMLMELAAAFRGLPDKALGRELSVSLTKNLAEESPEKVARIEALMEPKDRFLLQLGSLAVQRKPTHTEKISGGRMIQHTQPVNGLEGREKVMAEGLAAGLSRKEVLEDIGATLINLDRRPEALSWIDQYRDEVDFDTLLRSKLKTYGGTISAWTGGDLPEMQMIEWASRLNDTEQSRLICRGAYRRMLERSRDEAKSFLGRQDIPSDLIAEFQQIFKETS